MQFQLPFIPDTFVEPVRHHQRILLVGSCFTESIGERMARLKFRVLQNPHGIIYDPYSITNTIVSCIEQKKYSDADLINIGGLWHSWDHHGSFSGVDKSVMLDRINSHQHQSHIFLQKADWVFITLGSSYSYRLAGNDRPVANCHKAPAQTFIKRMLSIEEIKSSLDTCIHRLFHFNRDIKIIFTVSPVRYTRDGLINNNLSKSRLIEVVQHLVHKFSRLYYFPAFEIVNDVLRDYRFFKEDLVHPTPQAIDYVFEAFSQAAFDEETLQIIKEIDKVQVSLGHRLLHPGTEAAERFRVGLQSKIADLETRYPYISFGNESAGDASS